MNDATTGITATRNEITGSARIEIDLGLRARPLAYRVTKQMGSDRYVIRDPFGRRSTAWRAWRGLSRSPGS